ncbi:MAG: sodium:solute symporter [Deltaproteobacteria bacterium HGW-Deltaproteobacteria-14]|nr:MAG: sodium:solute symporter [Deltaproteobacteria bacterium HGW-Deltaproteobacteria-14]
MEHAPTWLSVLPPVLAIALAIATRQVFVSLFLGIWAGTTILAEGDPLSGLAAAIEACVQVFSDAGNTRVIIFSAMIGALIAITQRAGGVRGFIDAIARRGLVTTPRRAMLLSWLIGLVVFVESSITSLVNGAVCRPLFDKLRVSREKLAYLCDATAAPICVLIPLNAWGAYIAKLLTDEGVEQPVGVLVGAIPFNFYALLTVAFSLVFVVLMRRDFGPMRAAERRVYETGELLRPGAEPVVSTEITAIDAAPGIPHRALNFLLPIAVMVVMMPVGLWITGDGDLLAGSGSTAVLWAVLAATAVAAGLAIVQRILTPRESIDLFFKGFGGLIPLAMLMVFAFAIGAVTKQLGTGTYVAQVASGSLAPALAPALLFLVACFIAFSTGTSWGTFAIMLPIAVPMAAALGVPVELGVGAVLGGGVFGDHCSPISDTTIIASMAAGTDHIDHVNTQLPYALTVAGVSVAAYLVAGALV